MAGPRGWRGVSGEERRPSTDLYGMRLTTAQLALAREWNVPTPTASATIASWASSLEVQVGVIVDLVLEELVDRRRARTDDDRPDLGG